MKPYVIINAAMSADGKISTPLRKQTKISGAYHSPLAYIPKSVPYEDTVPLT